MGISCVSGIASSSRTLLSSELPKEGKQGSILHGNILDHIFFIILVIEIIGTLW